MARRWPGSSILRRCSADGTCDDGAGSIGTRPFCRICRIADMGSLAVNTNQGRHARRRPSEGADVMSCPTRASGAFGSVEDIVLATQPARSRRGPVACCWAALPPPRRWRRPRQRRGRPPRPGPRSARRQRRTRDRHRHRRDPGDDGSARCTGVDPGQVTATEFGNETKSRVAEVRAFRRQVSYIGYRPHGEP